MNQISVKENGVDMSTPTRASEESKTSIGNFVLASLISSYPDEYFNDDVNTIISDSEVVIPASLREVLVNFTSSKFSLEDLRSEYISLFDSGRGIAPLYETEYGRNRSFFKANELSDLAGFYKAFGFEFGGEEAIKEMLDHVSVELEFYALLKMKFDYLTEMKDQQGVEIVFEAQKKFMKDHLGRFTSAILERPGVSDSSYYGPIFSFINALVNDECSKLNIAPELVNWLGTEQETGEISCGGSVGKLQ